MGEVVGILILTHITKCFVIQSKGIIFKLSTLYENLFKILNTVPKPINSSTHQPISLSFLYTYPCTFDEPFPRGDLHYHMIRKVKIQYITSIVSILGVALLCYLALDLIGYQAVALVLLVVVSILAILFDIWPVLIAALLSALILNFFFIPPRFTFHITETEDILMFVMYFLVALVNAVLTNKIKTQEKRVRDK